MFSNDKVIWKEGLFLQPQHFQQMERFFFNSLKAHFAAYNRFYYGFLKCNIISDSLANKTFSLNSAQGIFPDGTFFAIPETGDIPIARNFSDHFTHEQKSLTVYLALPLVLPGRASIVNSKETNLTARYKSTTQIVPDDVSGLQNKDIELARANYIILFDGESLDNFTSLPIARLVRSVNGQVNIDKNFIPPLLNIGVSQILNEQLRSLLELLVAKSSNISQSRKQLKGGFAEFAPHEITPLTLLQTINSFIPVINNHYKSMNSHPYELYLSLLQLAGSLCTFSTQVDVTTLPVYDHSSLEQVFSHINQCIHSTLEANISAGCIPISSSEISPATYLFQINDQKLFETATFYLGIKAELPNKELVAFSLPRIKIASRNQLDTLIQSAMPGLPIMYVSNPPANLSSKPEFIYFSLNKQNKLWDMIKTTGHIAMYFPHKFSNLTLEMLALTE